MHFIRIQKSKDIAIITSDIEEKITVHVDNLKTGNELKKSIMEKKMGHEGVLYDIFKQLENNEFLFETIIQMNDKITIFVDEDLNMETFMGQKYFTALISKYKLHKI